MQNSIDERDQKRIRKQKEKEIIPDIFKGYMFCSKCKKELSFKRFFENDKPLYGKYYCSRCKGYHYSELTDIKLKSIISDQLNMQIKLCGAFEKILSSDAIKAKINAVKNKLTKGMDTQSIEVDKRNNKRHNTYLDYVDGLLEKDEYLILKEKQDKEFEEAKLKLNILKTKINEMNIYFEKDVLIKKLSICLNENTTPIEELLKCFIKRIEFDSKESVAIVFTFEDYLKKLKKIKEL